LKNKLSGNLRLIVILEIAAFLLLIIVGLIGYYYQIPFEDLTANPLSQLNIPFYQGILQRVGLILWGFVVILPLFTNYILDSSKIPGETKRFLLFSGIFFGYFLIDELLLIHNFIFPKVLNIHQLLVLILYAVTTFFFLLRFRNILNDKYSWVFLIAILFLGLSMIIDILSYLKVIQFEIRYFLDDGAKFLGIFNLFVYYFFYCKDLILDYKDHYKIKN
jgi:hypothetical protein